MRVGLRFQCETREEASIAETAAMLRIFESCLSAVFGPTPPCAFPPPMKRLTRGPLRLPPRLCFVSFVIVGAAFSAVAIRVEDETSVEHEASYTSNYDYNHDGAVISEPRTNSVRVVGDDASSMLDAARRTIANAPESTTTAATSISTTTAATTTTTSTTTSTTSVATTDSTTSFTTSPTTTDASTTTESSSTTTPFGSTSSEIKKRPPPDKNNADSGSVFDDCDCSISKDWLYVPDTDERISEVVSHSLKSLIMFAFGGLTIKEQRARIMLLDKDGSNTISENELLFLSALKAPNLRDLLRNLNVHSFETGSGQRLSVAASAAAAEVRRIEKLNSAEGLAECQCLDGMMGYRSLPSTGSLDEIQSGSVSSDLLKNITTRLAARIIARFRDMIDVDLDGDGVTDMWISPLLLSTEKKEKGRPKKPSTLRISASGPKKTSTTTSMRLKQAAKTLPAAKATRSTVPTISPKKTPKAKAPCAKPSTTTTKTRTTRTRTTTTMAPTTSATTVTTTLSSNGGVTYVPGDQTTWMWTYVWTTAPAEVTTLQATSTSPMTTVATTTTTTTTTNTASLTAQFASRSAVVTPNTAPAEFSTTTDGEFTTSPTATTTTTTSMWTAAPTTPTTKPATTSAKTTTTTSTTTTSTTTTATTTTTTTSTTTIMTTETTTTTTTTVASTTTTPTTTIMTTKTTSTKTTSTTTTTTTITTTTTGTTVSKFTPSTAAATKTFVKSSATSTTEDQTTTTALVPTTTTTTSPTLTTSTSTKTAMPSVQREDGIMMDRKSREASKSTKPVKLEQLVTRSSLVNASDTGNSRGPTNLTNFSNSTNVENLSNLMTDFLNSTNFTNLMNSTNLTNSMNSVNFTNIANFTNFMKFPNFNDLVWNIMNFTDTDWSTLTTVTDSANRVSDFMNLTNLTNLTNLLTNFTNATNVTDLLTNSTNFTNLTNLFTDFTNVTNSSNSTQSASSRQNQSKFSAEPTKRQVDRSSASPTKRDKKKKNLLKIGTTAHDTEKSAVTGKVKSKKAKRRATLTRRKSKRKALTESTLDEDLYRQADELIKQAGHSEDDASASDLLKMEAEIALSNAIKNTDQIRADAIEGLRQTIELYEPPVERVHLLEPNDVAIPSS
eukprot:TRINITY_DN1460_c0_g4_i1.p1 TRINITY_DN1460_c0_g4~~TRINITY_DN1460_c0_g4_i1.p1  ORF type:complete len:1121 (-),score=214.22 TRINITY_DN1460_c0_g4_i1:29-3391(-)